jgi:hypothetical protein
MTFWLANAGVESASIAIASVPDLQPIISFSVPDFVRNTTAAPIALAELSNDGRVNKKIHDCSTLPQARASPRLRASRGMRASCLPPK